MSSMSKASCAKFRSFTFLVLSVGLWGSGVSAQEEKPTELDRVESGVQGPSVLKDVVPAGDEEMTRLITELDDADFEIREKATSRLTSAGARAVPAVSRAAEGENLEAATRALQVLKTLYEGSDADAQAESAIALKRLCDSPRKAIARRAAAILDAPHQKAKSHVPPVGRGPGLRLNAPGMVPGGVARQISVQSINGQVRISVLEGNRRIEIRHSNQKDIVVKVSGPGQVGAEKQISEYKAKDLEELRERHPEAASLFDEYASQDQFQGMGGAFFPGGFPPAFPGLPEIRIQGGNRGPAAIRRRLPRNPLPPPDVAVESLEKTRKRLEGLVERLRELSSRPNIGQPDIEKLADELKSIEDEVSESADEVRQLGRP